ncbi:MAG: helix-turn-helix domain-containing protein [Acidimicrobiia bacterium]|nr:helix-turn-helix domain-containing protein [Acidimicrobiia bacterium]
MSYNEAVGQRLRSIRKQRGLSLQEVEEISGREFKASVLGAYERGERALSLPRLQRLAAFFNVSPDQLLPQEDVDEPRPATSVPSGGITVDLNKIDSLTGREAKLLEDFLRAIQMMRQDFNGRVLTIRRNDLRLLSLLLHQAEDDFSKRLTDLGVTTA